jgi:hypothetical protein
VVITEGADRVGRLSTYGDGVSAVEELVMVRSGHWRMLIPVRHVRRIHPAALPAARPGAPARSPVVSLDGDLVPVAFAAARAGASRVEIAAHHQLVELEVGQRRGLLWVDSAEDVVPLEPAPGEPTALVAGWSGADRPLPILDVAGLLELLD